MFGVVVCGVGAAVFVFLTYQPVIAAVLAFLAAVAVIDIAVIARRKARGEPG